MPSITLQDLEGAGTSSIPVGSLVPFHSILSIEETNDGQHWLRTGHVTTDISEYPLFTPYTDPDESVSVIGDPIAKTLYGLPLYMRIK